MGKGVIRGVPALAAVAVALALVAMMMMMSGAGVEAAACDSEIQKLASACAKYGSGSPGADCCNAARSIPASSYACLCANAGGVNPAIIKKIIAACNLGISYPCN